MWCTRNPHLLLVEKFFGSSSVEHSIELSHKIEMEHPYDPFIPFFWHLPSKHKKLQSPKYICCRTRYNIQDMKTNKYPMTEEWIRKLCQEYTVSTTNLGKNQKLTINWIKQKGV